MLAEFSLVKRYFGGRFGTVEDAPDGVYAIPTTTSKGPAFMRLQMSGGRRAGDDDFSLYWDEALTQSWYDKPCPDGLVESPYATAFRTLEAIR